MCIYIYIHIYNLYTQHLYTHIIPGAATIKHVRTDFLPRFEDRSALSTLSAKGCPRLVCTRSKRCVDRKHLSGGTTSLSTTCLKRALFKGGGSCGELG